MCPYPLPHPSPPPPPHSGGQHTQFPRTHAHTTTCPSPAQVCAAAAAAAQLHAANSAASLRVAARPHNLGVKPAISAAETHERCRPSKVISRELHSSLTFSVCPTSQQKKTPKKKKKHHSRLWQCAARVCVSLFVLLLAPNAPPPLHPSRCSIFTSSHPTSFQMCSTYLSPPPPTLTLTPSPNVLPV